MKLLSEQLKPDEIDYIVNRKLKWILSTASPLQVYLVGSAASKTMTTSSDVDLILIFEDDLALKQSMKLLWKARPKDDWPMDVLPYTKDQFKLSVSKGGGICWLALKEGKLVFSKGVNDVTQEQPRKIV
jgi:hypothetical protein